MSLLLALLLVAAISLATTTALVAACLFFGLLDQAEDGWPSWYGKGCFWRKK